MRRIAIVFLLVSATAAFAQTDCPVCDRASKLIDGLRNVEIGNAEQKAQAEALSKEGLALVVAFRDRPQPPKQGRKAFESLIALSAYAAPFSPAGDYEKALAVIGTNNPDYRKRYQALIRKGIRARDRRAACQMRYLQTNVSVAECKLGEAAAGASADLAAKRCDANYALEQCLARKR
ncbi:hypothetical protein [Pseudorhodoplanes sp.]|uniref:hypothetical protein n=1 Tax=Pseudorhodoplanes sp. TaxID=1934341 RepID=UPI002CEF92A5|nr:hypothetical protein [Pseudorhodoplanes sp.]HWV54084.1 hypothetical protein [Pseudorhodoplanes sp.]